jgi:predicted amidophosphoribosyltransferase
MAPSTCSGCGKEVDDQTPFCLNCGRPAGSQSGIPEGSAVCPVCGMVAPRSSACPACGTKLTGSSPSPQKARTSVLIAIAICLMAAALMGQALCAKP